jgi:hypothetical protein
VLIEEGSQQMRQSLTEAMLVMEAELTAESHPYKDLTLHASWWEDGERGALSEWRLVETNMSLFKDQVKGTYTAKRV